MCFTSFSLNIARQSYLWRAGGSLCCAAAAACVRETRVAIADRKQFVVGVCSFLFCYDNYHCPRLQICEHNSFSSFSSLRFCWWTNAVRGCGVDYWARVPLELWRLSSRLLSQSLHILVFQGLHQYIFMNVVIFFFNVCVKIIICKCFKVISYFFNLESFFKDL